MQQIQTQKLSLSNIIYIIIYILLFISLYLLIYDPICLDSFTSTDHLISNSDRIWQASDTDTCSVQVKYNESESKNINTEITTSVTYFSKIRRKIYWKIVEKDSGRYNSYNDFKKSWDPSFRFRKLLKDEFNEFKEKPIEFLKKEITLNQVRSKNRYNRLYNNLKSSN